MQEKRRRKRFHEATYAVMQVQYEAGELTLEAIGDLHDCSASYVCKEARERNWIRRRPAPAGGSPTTPPRPPRRRNPHATMLKRMRKVINGKLKQMEDDLKTGAANSADLERDAKVVTSMIGGMQKVPRPEEDKVRDAQAGNAGGTDEVERLQREIIERFERIQLRRLSQAGSE